jgi:hypothetical protein
MIDSNIALVILSWLPTKKADEPLQRITGQVRVGV